MGRPLRRFLSFCWVVPPALQEETHRVISTYIETDVIKPQVQLLRRFKKMLPCFFQARLFPRLPFHLIFSFFFPPSFTFFFFFPSSSFFSSSFSFLSPSSFFSSPFYFLCLARFALVVVVLMVLGETRNARRSSNIQHDVGT